jgi:hypothetical protein
MHYLRSDILLKQDIVPLARLNNGAWRSARQTHVHLAPFHNA